MKTLSELIGESLDMQASHTKQVADIVGAVQEWLGQDEIVDVIDFRNFSSSECRDQLRRMAGQHA